MGIFLNLAVSKSVTKEAWEKAYKETLGLVEKLPLAEQKEKVINGIEVMCLTHSGEGECSYEWYGERRIGWSAHGDLDTLRTAEDYFLDRDLVSDKTYDPDAGDALLGAVPNYTSYSWEDERFQKTYSLWGAKTQGEAYHIYLLAVACLLETRLGDKVFIYGDITKGQCRRAVEIANRYLEEKIDLPDRCYPEKLLRRIEKLDFTEVEKLEIFDVLYLGSRDKEYGKAFCNYFSDVVRKEYWKQKFAGYDVDMMGFERLLQDFLTCGFDLSLLCEVVECRDKNGNEAYDKFICHIMDTKMYLQEKDCRDALRIDQEEEGPYNIWRLMAQFTFADARNKHVDRYIPLEEIREVLTKAFADKCDVNSIMDSYLEREVAKVKAKINETMTYEEFEAACKDDAPGMFCDFMDRTQKADEEQREKFDICRYGDLRSYETGMSAEPKFLEALQQNFKLYDDLAEEERYKDLLSKDAYERCKWLIKNNRCILLKDSDWEKIFADIEADTASFRRYYPMVRVRVTSDALHDLIAALVTNDAAYALCKELLQT